MPLTWRHTWPERGPDFVAEDEGFQIGRIYDAKYPAPSPRWFWALNGVHTRPLPTAHTGSAHTKQEAADAVRAAWEACKAWSAETGTALSMGRGGMRPPDATPAVARS